MTAFFHDSNEPAYFSSGDTSLYWWQTPQSYEINVLEIIRKIASRFPVFLKLNSVSAESTQTH